MVAASVRSLFVVLLCCVGLSAHALQMRFATRTPRATVSALHTMHALTASSDHPQRLAFSRASLASLAAPKRLVLEQYDPTIFRPQVDLEAVLARMHSDLAQYQTERGLAATGDFDAVTVQRLGQDDADSRGLALARSTLIDDRKVAILRKDISNGMLWRLSLLDQPDVLLPTLDSVNEELNSSSGGRPVIFAAATGQAEINEIQSSLRLSGGGTPRPVPIVLSGEPTQDKLLFLRHDRLDASDMAGAFSSAKSLRGEQGYYRQIDHPNGAGASLQVSLWAKTRLKLLRVVELFIAFAAAQNPESQSLAELMARFRDYLFDRGYDFSDAGIEFGSTESLTRQWATIPVPRSLPVL